MNKLEKEITEIIILATQCYSEQPKIEPRAIDLIRAKSVGFERYQNEPLFHTVVQFQVSSIMLSIERYLQDRLA